MQPARYARRRTEASSSRPSSRRQASARASSRGTEEARLIHLAAGYGLGLIDEVGVTVDIGGGSVEITHGTGPTLATGRSFKLGVIRLTERFVKSDPLSQRDERRMVRHILSELKTYLKSIKEAGFDRVVGTSGSILSVGIIVVLAPKGFMTSQPMESIPFHDIIFHQPGPGGGGGGGGNRMKLPEKKAELSGQIKKPAPRVVPEARPADTPPPPPLDIPAKTSSTRR